MTFKELLDCVSFNEVERQRLIRINYATFCSEYPLLILYFPHLLRHCLEISFAQEKKYNYFLFAYPKFSYL